MTEITVSNPGTIRIGTRRAELKRWQNSPEFKQMREEHARCPGAECRGCHRKHGQQKYDPQGNPKMRETKKGLVPDLVTLTINHRDRASYLTKEKYCTWDPLTMEVICPMCNLAFERGEKPCPDCLKKGKVTYIKWFDEECEACYLIKHPDVAAQMAANKAIREEGARVYKRNRAIQRKAAKVKHPCTFHGYGQKCRIDNCACAHSPTKAAKNCTTKFKLKKKMEKKT